MVHISDSKVHSTFWKRIVAVTVCDNVEHIKYDYRDDDDAGDDGDL